MIYLYQTGHGVYGLMRCCIHAHTMKRCVKQAASRPITPDYIHIHLNKLWSEPVPLFYICVRARVCVRVCMGETSTHTHAHTQTHIHTARERKKLWFSIYHHIYPILQIYYYKYCCRLLLLEHKVKAVCFLLTKRSHFKPMVHLTSGKTSH